MPAGCGSRLRKPEIRLKTLQAMWEIRARLSLQPARWFRPPCLKDPLYWESARTKGASWIPRDGHWGSSSFLIKGSAPLPAKSGGSLRADGCPTGAGLGVWPFLKRWCLNTDKSVE
jgi:hypothetical protein